MQCLPGPGASPWRRPGKPGAGAKKNPGAMVPPGPVPEFGAGAMAPPGLKVFRGRGQKCQPGHGPGGSGNPGSCFDEFSKCGVLRANRI